MEKILLAAAIVLICMFLLAAAWRSPLTFVGLHVFSRVILDGFSSITYESIFMNLSIMQVYSIAVIAAMALYLFTRKDFGMKSIPALYPIAVLIVCYLMSGIVSYDWAPIIENVTKWIYMILFAGLIAYTLQHYSLTRVVSVFWISLLPAVLIQMHALAIGEYVIAAGGHSAYFGGYQHQNMLSYLLLGFIMASFYLSIKSGSSFIGMFYGFSGMYGILALYFCGYRTTMIAMFVFLLIALSLYVRSEAIPKRVFVMCVAPIILSLCFMFLGSDIWARLTDIWVFLSSPGDYIDFSGSAAHTSLFSGRLVIINRLMAVYLSAPFEAKVVGLGIEASQKIIGTYPHNEFVAALVETGIAGFIVLIMFVAYYLHAILKFRVTMNVEESIIIGAGVGLIVMTLATMPFRDMRAMLLFGLILGISSYKNRGLGSHEKH